MGTAKIPCRPLDLIYCENRKPYLILTTGVFRHISNKSSLNNLEKLYYLLADLYAHLGKQINGLREAEKSGREWAKLLGCSEEWVFKMQKKLEANGYFYIIREKDQDNQNEKNIIIPTLPCEIFMELSTEPNRVGQEHLIFTEDDHAGCKRSFLDDAKLFIKINLQMLKLLLSDPSLSSLQKLIWVYCFTRSHISYTDSYGDGTRNFITTYQELAAIFSCKENTISTAMNTLFLLGYISKKQFRIKEQGKASRRKKKSCWEISALFPKDQTKILLQQPDRQNLAPLSLDDLRLYDFNNHDEPSSTDKNIVSDSIYYQDRSAVSRDTKQYYNKNNILNIKNIVEAHSQTTNKTALVDEGSNVFYTKKLIVSDDELVLGLEIATKFDEQALANLENLEKNIKQTDLALSKDEHWLVTKTAFVLYKQFQAEMQSRYGTNHNDLLEAAMLKETLFTPVEQRLVDLWESFSDLPEQAAQEEFLLRKSWLLKLLPQTKETIDLNPEATPSEPKIKLQGFVPDLSALPGDKADKAKKFAKKLKTKGLAKGYATNISIEDLTNEFIYHAINWTPERLNCKTREEQIDAALSFAWKAVEQGKWQCPYRVLNAQIAQREMDAASWKNW